MSKELMDIVLPRLAQRLNRQLRRYRAGELDDDQFSRKFETLLQQQFSWLANQGIPEVEAAIAVHGAVLVLSGPGLRAEAAELSLPLEVIEHRAIPRRPATSPSITASASHGHAPPASIVAYYAE